VNSINLFESPARSPLSPGGRELERGGLALTPFGFPSSQGKSFFAVNSYLILTKLKSVFTIARFGSIEGDLP
jgi:hypothetical protein